MRTTLLGVCLLAMLLISGCFEFPLGDPETAVVNENLTGIYDHRDGTRGTLLTVIPYDKRTFLVTAYQYRVEDSTFERAGMSVAKTWITPVADANFVTLDLLTTDLAQAKSHMYYIARFDVTASGVNLREVNEEFGQQAKTADALTRLIGDNLNNEAMYNPAVSYIKVQPSEGSDAAKILDLFK